MRFEREEEDIPALQAKERQHCSSKMTTTLPAEEQSSVAERTDACVAMDSCSEFVACIMPLHEEMFQKYPRGPAQQ